MRSRIILLFILITSLGYSQDRRQELWNNVNFHNLRGDYPQAVTYMDSIIMMGDNLAKNYLYRGYLKQSSGLHQEAIADYDQSISLNPNIVDTYVRRGVVKFELEQYDAAISDFDKGIGTHGWQDSTARRYRGRAYHSINKYEEAIKDYNAALAYNPKDVELISNTASAYMAIGDDARAFDLIERALKVEQDYIEATKKKSILNNADYMNIKSALELSLSYQKFHPLDAQNNLNVGYLYVRLKKPEQALKNLNKVSGELSDTYDFYYNRGMAYYYILDNKRAIANFEAAIQAQPDKGLPYVFIAECYKGEGKMDKSCASLKKASELGVLGAEELMANTCK